MGLVCGEAEGGRDLERNVGKDLDAGGRDLHALRGYVFFARANWEGKGCPECRPMMPVAPKRLSSSGCIGGIWPCCESN